MNRALTSNADLSFDLTPDLSPDTETSLLLSSTDHLLDLRRKNLGIGTEEKKKQTVKTRSSPRIARKLRFSKDVRNEDLDVDVDVDADDSMDTN
jgi:hypothetical protein